MTRVRSPLATAAVLVLAVVATPLPVALARTDTVTVTNGPLMAQQEAVGNGDSAVQRLDYLDGTRVTLPFVPGGGDFSPDGARLAYVGAARDASGVRRDAVLVRRTNGSQSVLGFLTGVDEVHWSGDGTYVVALRVDPSTGISSVWRLAAGQSPVKLITATHESRIDYLDVDPTSDLVTYLRYPDIYGIDAITAAKTRLTTNCATPDPCDPHYQFENVAWAPDGSRILVRYRETDPGDSSVVDRLGWLIPGQQVPTPIRDFADNEYANNPLVSPDGTLVALQIDDNSFVGSHTELLGADGGAVTPESLLLPHVAWQPCPTGAPCPVFVAPPATAPSQTHIGTAFSGAAGGSTTARATWRAPSSTGGKAISSYQVQAMRLNAANDVVARVNTTKGASARSATMSLRAGRYAFRVRAENAVGAGPWSGRSNIVTSR